MKKEIFNPLLYIVIVILFAVCANPVVAEFTGELKNPSSVEFMFYGDFVGIYDYGPGNSNTDQERTIVYIYIYPFCSLSELKDTFEEMVWVGNPGSTEYAIYAAADDQCWLGTWSIKDGYAYSQVKECYYDRATGLPRSCS
ncbi:MAG: hypothetical protein LBV40_01355 [Methanomicrobiales archaeon]|jgi:hypothetical protein|nr:hypothetical protein [Methanomicrobiales archaeon]